MNKLITIKELKDYLDCLPEQSMVTINDNYCYRSGKDDNMYKAKEIYIFDDEKIINAIKTIEDELINGIDHKVPKGIF